MKQSDSFEIFDGSGAVMISAPHNVEHVRNGIIRFAEPQTGLLAIGLHKKLNVPVIVKTVNENDDANFDEVSSYKDRLVKYLNAHKSIKLLIDLHQLAPERETAVDIGIADGINFVDDEFVSQIVYAFQKNGIDNVVTDFPFKGAGKNTVSSFVRARCDVQTIQLELNTNLLVDEYTTYNFDGVFDALKSVIELYNSKEGNNE